MAQWLPRTLSTILLGSSLLTAYEFGVLRMTPMPVYLLLDVVPDGPAGRPRPG